MVLKTKRRQAGIIHAHHNHDVRFMARELNDWLGKGINALVEGSYTPRFLKRCYFKDEMIDQLHLSDRVLQHKC